MFSCRFSVFFFQNRYILNIILLRNSTRHVDYLLLYFLFKLFVVCYCDFYVLHDLMLVICCTSYWLSLLVLCVLCVFDISYCLLFVCYFFPRLPFLSLCQIE
jgi:hypothetical protein